MPISPPASEVAKIDTPGIPMRAVTDLDGGRVGDFQIWSPNGNNKGELYFICPNGRQCGVAIRHGEFADTGIKRWGWDGNSEAPTLKPSINCRLPSGCGWHGHVTQGRLTNA